jgi:hypothetical protein
MVCTSGPVSHWPMQAMRPLRITTVALRRGAAPVPSITVAPVRAKAGTGASPGEPNAVLTAIFQLPSGCFTSTRSETPRWLPPCTTR